MSEASLFDGMTTTGVAAGIMLGGLMVLAAEGGTRLFSSLIADKARSTWVSTHQADAEAEAELERAIAAAEAAPTDEKIPGLGGGVAPLIWKVQPGSPHPAQYKTGLADGEQPLLFAYLSIRGLGETQRLMLAEAGASYIHVAVTMGEEQEVALEWRSRSPNGLMPMLSGMGVPRGKPISQSGAIIRFLARKYGMEGSTALDAINADVLYETAKDFIAKRQEVLNDAGDHEAAKGPWALAKRIEAMLDASPSASESSAALTYGQLQLFKGLHEMDEIKPGSVATLSPKLEAFRVAVAARPRIAAYLASPMRFPLLCSDVGKEGGYNYASGPVARGAFHM